MLMRTAARKVAPARQRIAETASFTAPIAGWISNRALAQPETGPQGAAVLENFFPTATGAVLRRGRQVYVQVSETGAVRSIFKYVVGANRHLFTATDDTIYDITTIISPVNLSVGIPQDYDIGEDDDYIIGEQALSESQTVWDGATGGDWYTVQFSVTGGVFLIGVNGASTGFIYDGAAFYPNVPGGVWALSYDAGTADFTPGATVTGDTSGATATILDVVPSTTPGEGGLLLTNVATTPAQWTIDYESATGDFTVGDILTGGTSQASGKIAAISDNGDGTGTLTIENLIGNFQSGEAIEDSSGASADSTTAETYIGGGDFRNDELLTDGDGGSAAASSDPTSVAPGITFPDGLTTADMAFVWVYKNSLWFVQKGSMTAWYMPVDSIGGTAKRFDLAPEFGQGGTLLIGQSWSLNASGQGGLSEQCVFVSSEGEVVVYQGINPDEASTWSKVGTYRIGIPMGRRAFIRAGGDLILATTIGFVSLSTAVQVDVAALAPKAVSYFIEDAWNTAVSQRGRENWVCCLWPESQMVAIAPPTGEQSPMFLVSNARTGAWAPFTNWDASCMEVFEGQLYFGTPDGYVMAAMVAGTDDGVPFTGTYVPLFTDAGKPTIRKAARQALAELISASEINEKLSCKFDFDLNLPSPPDVEPIPVGNEWDNAIWNESVWSADRGSIVGKRRHSVSGFGYRIAPVLQITSGAVVPLDAQIVSLNVTYESGDYFT